MMLCLAILFYSVALGTDYVYNVECSQANVCFQAWSIQEISPVNGTATLNPTIHCLQGDTLSFQLSAPDVMSHPFEVLNASGTPVPTAQANNPLMVPGILKVDCLNGKYRCVIHAPMSGAIVMDTPTPEPSSTNPPTAGAVPSTEPAPTPSSNVTVNVTSSCDELPSPMSALSAFIFTFVMGLLFGTDRLF